MTRQTIECHLSALPHFRALSDDVIARIAQGCRMRTWRKLECIFSANETARAFFAVVEGSVRIYRANVDGRDQILHHLRVGQSFAEAAVLNFGSYPADARAMESPTVLLEIPREHVLGLLREDHRIAAAMVGSLSRWILVLADRVEELSIASVGVRLARHLLRLPATSICDELTIVLPGSKKDLAEHLSIAPETLSRLLRVWRERGILESQGRSILLRDPRVLEAIADGVDDVRSADSPCP